MLLDVDGLLDFTLVPLLFSAEYPGVLLGHRVSSGQTVFTHSSRFVPVQVLFEPDPEGPLGLHDVRVVRVVITGDMIYCSTFVLQGEGRSSLFTGSKDRACDRESREDHGKRKGRNHSGSRRDEQRGQGRYDGYSEDIPGSTQEDETSESWPDHSVRDSTLDRKQEPTIQELEEDVDQQNSTAAMQARGRGIRGAALWRRRRWI